MEFASFLAGERWSDHPACTHPLLAALARDVNDLTTDDARGRLTPLIHRVVGLIGAGPTGAGTNATTIVAIVAATSALPVASLERQRALAVGLLSALSFTPDPALHRRATEAFSATPGVRRWAERHLAASNFPRQFHSQSAEAIVHTAAMGIALACIDDADDRMAALLTDAIEALEGLGETAPELAVADRAPAFSRG